MSQKYEKLKGLLKELFQLDQPDLDFGLYRIMHAKSAEVTQFLDKDLLPQVKEAFRLYKTADKAELENELASAIDQAHSLGVPDPDLLPKVKELRAKLATDAIDIGALENEVYDHLFSFFRRYYSEGDFLAKRVYRPGVYSIPYEGEEITLHWANKDQFYIKTDEYLRDYTFRLRPDDEKKRVHFQLADAAEGEHGNVKPAEGKDRLFILCSPGQSGHDFIAEEESDEGKELIIRFEYRQATLTDWPEDQRDGKTKPPTQKELISLSEKMIFALRDASLAPWIIELAKPHFTPDEEKAEYTRLEAHLRRYSARNAFDYFIHKDLSGFLRRELDFYIKNEVMYLDDVENDTAPRVEQYLSKVRVIRRIASKIIAFLAQLENFQRKLWLKKKFVIETSYCIALRCIPKAFHDEIAANNEQREEWVRLLAINEAHISDVTAAPKYTAPLTPQFLQHYPTLMVDTRHFADSFVERLLEAIGEIDHNLDGVLVQSENFQALSLAQARYRGRVRCIYIDPPYNTGQDGFVYKDSFKSSSWSSMIRDRIELARTLLTDNGVLFSSINEIERSSLEWQLGDIFGARNRVEELIWVRDTMSNNSPTYSTNHEYVEVFARDLKTVEGDRNMFREPKPGLTEVMDLITSLRGDFPPTAEIESRLNKLYQEHRLRHVQEAIERGESKEDALKSDSWKGLYPYKRAEYRDGDGHLIEEKKAKERAANIWIWREVEPSMPAGKQSDTIRDPDSDNYRFYEPPHPVTQKPCKPPKRGWAFPWHAMGDRPSFVGYEKDDRIVFKEDEQSIPQLKYFLHEVETIVSTSVVRQYADGEPRLEALFGRKGLIDNPKPPGLVERFIRQTTRSGDLVLDFFGGSGTTAHAVIETNRAGESLRRFFLVEMAGYFDSVLIPRIKKVTFSPMWEAGKPLRPANQLEAAQSPRIVKVIRLESYEDALNNLDVRRTSKQQTLLDTAEAAGGNHLREQYLLRYMLDVETRGSHSLLNVQAFSNPTDYKLRVKKPGSDETRETNVDLVETFNWLVGLTVLSISVPQSFEAVFERDSEKRLQLRGKLKQFSGGPWWFRIVEGVTPEGRKTLIVWRKLTGDLERDNLVLDVWMKDRLKISTKDFEFDLIYVNGDNNLENLKLPDDTWKVRLIEEDFHRLMFDAEGA